MRNPPADAPASSDCFLLAVVLVVVMVIALEGYAFSELMLLARRRSTAATSSEPASCSIRRRIPADVPHAGQADPARLRRRVQQSRLTQGVLVSYDANNPANPKAAGKYSIISPAVDADAYLAGVRYRLENESSRLNLNALLIAEQNVPGSGRQLLMVLPGCTVDIADAPLDVIDAYDEPPSI